MILRSRIYWTIGRLGVSKQHNFLPFGKQKGIHKHACKYLHSEIARSSHVLRQIKYKSPRKKKTIQAQPSGYEAVK